jgi:hypothetical protein
MHKPKHTPQESVTKFFKDITTNNFKCLENHVDVENFECFVPQNQAVLINTNSLRYVKW